MESIFQNALTFFLLANPIGNSPAIIALIKDLPFERQKKIMLREGCFALIVALFFQYLGQYFLSALDIQKYAVTLCGGTILFLISLHMIFSLSRSQEPQESIQEPFLVPIATPLISGPGLLAIIMLKSGLDPKRWHITAGILIAWVGVLSIMAVAPYLQRVLGKRGLMALEQLMGLILSLVAMNMLVKGLRFYIETLGQTA
jgi:multiple antibiotic resistance protein